MKRGKAFERVGLRVRVELQTCLHVHIPKFATSFNNMLILRGLIATVL